MKLPLSAFVIFCASLFVPAISAQNLINRVEPPNWWVGMEEAGLQLLIYGEAVGYLTPEITYSGIQVEKVTKVKNPNYLFVDLKIDPATKPGTVPIAFVKDGKIVTTYSYTLQMRKEGAAEIPGFDNSDVMYLITPDRFVNGNTANDNVAGMREKLNRSFKGGRHGGDIAGMRQRLDYLKDLGFTAIWINPLLENDMEEYSYHGYSTTDFYKVDPRFGSNEEYQTLCQEARGKGIKVIMDMIVNHCGLEHWWMKDLPMDDWINTWPAYTNTNHRKVTIQDPHGTEMDRKLFTDGWFVPTMPDLNQRNEFLGTYLIQNSIWWVEYLGLAGIRMDTYPYPDMDYMTAWTKAMMKEYPNLNIVGEEWFGDPALVSYWQKGKVNPNGYTSELRSLMDFPVNEALIKSLNDPNTGNCWAAVYEMLAKDFLYPDPDNLVIFPDNHDMNRFYTWVNEDYELFKLGITFFLTTRGIPQIYYGTEILMGNTGFDGDHGIIRTDLPGGWPGDKVNAFTGEGLSAQQKDAQAFMKKLLNWRKTNSVVHWGKMIHYVPENGVYVYFRVLEDKKLMVILNRNKTATALNVDRFEEVMGHSHEGKEVISGQTYKLIGNIDLPPMAPLVLELK
ncbi:MAG TPA: glycoside hydrolase family 13 protein [Saprospiraceae bacterium]|nr:glycoside hydrolase family 13 protein [Saprospiraceae bacterium]HMQ83021.1 glycoside hydrolase family 13 protein [Saprospiraceae bacterium]